jgi:hypothetical protein
MSLVLGDNKNTTIFGLGAALVAGGFFDKVSAVYRPCHVLPVSGLIRFDQVKVCFHIVGHTHELIDQVFSRIAGWVKL